MNAPEKYEVTAHQWEHGWELHVDGLGVTQVSALDKADRQVREYICTVLDLDEYDGRVVIVPEVGAIADTIRTMHELTDSIAELQAKSSATRNEAVQQMRAFGLSDADIAGALGVSKGRVSQIVNA